MPLYFLIFFFLIKIIFVITNQIFISMISILMISLCDSVIEFVQLTEAIKLVTVNISQQKPCTQAFFHPWPQETFLSGKLSFYYYELEISARSSLYCIIILNVPRSLKICQSISYHFLEIFCFISSQIQKYLSVCVEVLFR